MLRRWWFVALVPALLYAAPAQAQGGWGWGSRVAPETEKEKAYVEDARKLRSELWQKQRELWDLQTQEKPSASALKAKETEVNTLRRKLSDLNYKNRELRWQMMDRARQNAARSWMGRGVRGMGPGAGMHPRGMGGRGAWIRRPGSWGGCAAGVCPWKAPAR
ncbi:MAG TPA: hypothetical protein PLU39_08500 [Armatimonadota bacterium]|jgi:hypothetical protein|nr:hypothetical protein [Armatimonadota bacterium]HOJ19970.1 hypothetical protein [Armatimonadota bacterium]HOM82083.1 hypothetical protein [Armatimonadota bacterium]HOQ27822.1 hypothetical protein [Armatimonadota bacterium]HPO73419.1 hypothetical protein [Armatimonadota bacterium]